MMLKNIAKLSTGYKSKYGSASKQKQLNIDDSELQRLFMTHVVTSLT
jgi:hypothetical protein